MVWFILLAVFAAQIGLIIWDARDKRVTAPSEDDHRAAEMRLWRHQKVINYVTACGAIVAATVAIYAYLETKRTGDAAVEQVEIAKDTAKRQLRAYLIVRSEAVDDFEIGKKPVVRATVENMGQTPAYQVQSYAGASIISMDSKMTYEPKTCAEIMKMPDANPAFFGKSAGRDRVSQLALSPFFLAEIKAGRMGLFHAGKICYLDIYQTLHHLEFCHFYRWEGTSNGKLSSAQLCTFGNDSDGPE